MSYFVVFLINLVSLSFLWSLNFNLVNWIDFVPLIFINIGFLLYKIKTIESLLLKSQKNSSLESEKINDLFSEFKNSTEQSIKEQNYLFCKYLDDKISDFQEDRVTLGKMIEIKLKNNGISQEASKFNELESKEEKFDD